MLSEGDHLSRESLELERALEQSRCTSVIEEEMRLYSVFSSSIYIGMVGSNTQGASTSYNIIDSDSKLWALLALIYIFYSSLLFVATNIYYFMMWTIISFWMFISSLVMLYYITCLQFTCLWLYRMNGYALYLDQVFVVHAIIN